MGERKRRRLKQTDMLSAEPRCIYCASPATSVEHMPPIGMFKGRDRPQGMEYASCERCNSGTRGADAVAAMFARLGIDAEKDPWKVDEARKLKSAVRRWAPGVYDEVFQTAKRAWGTTTSGLLRPVIEITTRGPLFRAYISSFSGKLGMALYREHVGRALPLDGNVWFFWSFPGGMPPDRLKTILSIMPLFKTLSQGAKSVEGQFDYFYNSDEKSVTAALCHFHQNLFIATITSADNAINAIMQAPDIKSIKATGNIRPGELVEILSRPIV